MPKKTVEISVTVPLEKTGNTGNTGNACAWQPVLTGVPGWAYDAVKQAAALSQAARAAALAGDHNRARELRAEYDRLYDDIEAQAATLAGMEAQAVEEAQPAGDLALLRVFT